MVMYLELSRLDRGGIHESFRIGRDHPLLQAYEPEVREPLRLEVDLTVPSPGTYVLEAALDGTVFEPCRRCLAPVAVEVAEHFRIVFRESWGSGEESGDDDLVLLAPRASRIEFGDQVRDRLFLETDWYPLCHPGCRGVCPICGQELNAVDCGCEEATSNDRWSALREI